MKNISFLASLLAFVLFAGGYQLSRAENREEGNAPKVTENSKEIMKHMEKNMRILNGLISGKVRAKDVNKEILEHAILLQTLTEDIPGLFPEKLKGEIAEAAPDVWKKRHEFVAAAESMKQRVAEFAEVAKRNDFQKMQEAYKRLDISETCIACHKSFRKNGKTQ